MNPNRSDQIPARCNPVFSIAGVMPTASEMAWKTAYPNPDAAIAAPRTPVHAVSLSIAGAMSGRPDTGWHTAMPDPTRDMLDGFGHIVAIAGHSAPAELAPRRRVLMLQPALTHVVPTATS